MKKMKKMKKNVTSVGGDDACPDFDLSHHAYDDVFCCCCGASSCPYSHSFCPCCDGASFLNLRNAPGVCLSRPPSSSRLEKNRRLRKTYGDYDDYDDDYFFCWISICFSSFLSPKMKIHVFESVWSRKRLSLSKCLLLLRPIATKVKEWKCLVKKRQSFRECVLNVLNN